MASGGVNNQNSWTPYDYKDCSLGICSIYCPHFCYFIFPPPPPPDADDSASPFSPLIIAIIGVLASAFILVSYYTLATRFCRRNPDASVESEEIHAQVARDQWQAAAAAASGLEEAAIKAITVCRYHKGDGLIEGSECAVCLSEFEENEALRLLPKCSHAFHLPCIDTWLKSHSNCPLCRAVVAVSPPLPSHVPLMNAINNNHNHVDPYEFERPRDLIVVVDHEQELHCLASGGGDAGEGNNNAERRKEQGDDGGEGGSRHLRRSLSLGRSPSPSQHVMVEMGEIDQDLGRNRIMRCKSINGISSSKEFSVEVVRDNRGSDLP